MRAPERIGVVGMGLLTPLGDTIDGAWLRLLEGDSAIRRMGFSGLADIAAAPVDTDVSTVLGKLQQVGTERVSLLALGAARRALADAGIERWDDAERVGLYVGTGMGGATTIDLGYAALGAGRRLSPLTVPSGMVNGAAAVVALHTGIKGPVITYAVACASSAVAITEAAHALRRGEIDIALVGGAEAPLARGTVAAWQALRTLAAPQAHEVERTCRPFSRDRGGMVLGEGAAFLVLLRESDAMARERPLLAWLLGGAVRCDAAHLTNPDVRGQVSTLRAAFDATGISAADIGYCNAHGTATLAGDPVECEALRQVWGKAAPDLAVSSTKAAHGHLLGAAGAVEAVWALQAVRTGSIPPTGDVTEIDPACQGLGHVAGSALRRPDLRYSISNSFAFGGTNVTLVFGKA